MEKEAKKESGFWPQFYAGLFVEIVGALLNLEGLRAWLLPNAPPLTGVEIPPIVTIAAGTFLMVGTAVFFLSGKVSPEDQPHPTGQAAHPSGSGVECGIDGFSFWVRMSPLQPAFGDAVELEVEGPLCPRCKTELEQLPKNPILSKLYKFRFRCPSGDLDVKSPFSGKRLRKRAELYGQSMVRNGLPAFRRPPNRGLF